MRPTILLLLLMGFAFAAEAAIAVYPKSLDIDSRTRSGAFTLVNDGGEDITVRVSWVDRRMTPSGDLETVPSGQSGWSAAPLLRHSPRQVTIPAGGSQTVRVLYRRPASLAVGEYHSHLTFQELPRVAAVGSADAAGVSVQINTVFGIAVPVFVREGSPAPGRLSCADLRWQPAAAGKPPALLARFARSGEQRASAVFQVFHRRDGAWQPLTQSQSLLVYAELAERELSIELPAGDYAPGSVLLRLADRSSDETTRAEPVDCAPR